mmetsp:Transcript_70882/g.168145  ORF Transcript_70882/g.168145 Transcript_70882/m.168145 type:complete len:270 (-) Transcript_70882:239-1048(-)
MVGPLAEPAGVPVLFARGEVREGGCRAESRFVGTFSSLDARAHRSCRAERPRGCRARELLFRRRRSEGRRRRRKHERRRRRRREDRIRRRREEGSIDEDVVNAAPVVCQLRACLLVPACVRCRPGGVEVPEEIGQAAPLHQLVQPDAWRILGMVAWRGRVARVLHLMGDVEVSDQDDFAALCFGSRDALGHEMLEPQLEEVPPLVDFFFAGGSEGVRDPHGREVGIDQDKRPVVCHHHTALLVEPPQLILSRLFDPLLPAATRRLGRIS